MTNPEPLPAALPPIEINPSAIRTLLLMLVRVIAIVVTALGTIVAFVQTRDLAGFIAWIKTDEFAQVVTSIGLLVSFGSSAWITLSRKWREVYLARHVDDRIAVVKAPTPPPSVEDVAPGA